MASSSAHETASSKRNACWCHHPGEMVSLLTKQHNTIVTELMNPKLKQLKAMPAPDSTTATTSSGTAESIPRNRRDGLGAYIANPASFPSSTVISHTADFVTIRDLYPKSSIHLLVIPRDPTKSSLHPFEALQGPDSAFLASVRAECAKAKSLAASELRRRFGKFSAQDQAREAALCADPAPDSLPTGRDWSHSIMVGVHAVPSMSHLHIHIISVDRHSDCLRHRKHYNSFSTPFFVPLDDFPLDRGDDRRWPDREGYLKRDFKCWRCGRIFGKEFKKLKAHLEEEFEEWKTE
jgi:aprataxin